MPDIIPIAGLTAVASLAAVLQKYTAETVTQAAEVTVEVQLKKHYRIVTASVLGAIAIALVTIVLKVVWNSLR